MTEREHRRHNEQLNHLAHSKEGSLWRSQASLDLAAHRLRQISRQISRQASQGADVANVTNGGAPTQAGAADEPYARQGGAADIVPPPTPGYLDLRQTSFRQARTDADAWRGAARSLGGRRALATRRRRLMCSVDLTGYGRRDERSQAAAQRDLAAVLDRAGREAGLDRGSWARQPRGDGELAILPDEESEAMLIDDYVRRLAVALADSNHERNEASRLRMRMAVHHGIAYQADLGYAGSGVLEVTRLVDSRTLRRVLRAAPMADLVLGITHRIYDDTVCQRATSMTPAQFRRVYVRNKEYGAAAWLYVPGTDVQALDLGPSDERLVRSVTRVSRLVGRRSVRGPLRSEPHGDHACGCALSQAAARRADARDSQAS